MTEQQARSSQESADRQAGVVLDRLKKSAMLTSVRGTELITPTLEGSTTTCESVAPPEAQTSGDFAQKMGDSDKQAEPSSVHTPDPEELDESELPEVDSERDLREREFIDEGKRARRRKYASLL